MGNGAKVALVALLILMVVVIARFVRKDSAPKRTQAPATAAAGAQAGTKAVASPALKPSPAKKEASSPSGVASASRAPTVVKAEPRPTTPTPPSASSLGDSGSAAPAAPTPSSPGTPLRTADLAPKQPPERSSAQPETPGKPESFVAATTPATGPERPPVSTKWETKEAMLTSATPPATGTPDTSGRPPEPRFSTAGWQAPPSGSGARAQEPIPDATKARSDQTSTRSDSVEPSGQPSSRSPGNTDAKASGFPKKYAIQPGDTYSKIARTHYGSAHPRLLSHLEKANPGLDPTRLPVGKEITIPAPPADWTPPQPKDSGTSTAQSGQAPVAPEAKSVPVRAPLSYLVQRGDTLTKLARRFYGDEKKYYLIEEANESLKYGGELIAGSTITIPPLR